MDLCLFYHIMAALIVGLFLGFACGRFLPPKDDWSEPCSDCSLAAEEVKE